MLNLYLDDILPRVPSRNQLLSVLVQLGDGGLLGLQTFADEVLLREGPLELDCSYAYNLHPSTTTHSNCVSGSATSYCLWRAV